MANISAAGPFESQAAVCAWLNQFSHPWLQHEWADTPGIVQWQQDTTQLKITIPFAAASLAETLADWIADQQARQLVPQLSVDIAVRVSPLAAGDKPLLKGVKNVLVVSSAKGGVGKSTTAVNLALGLKALGAKVGLLDADIYGPSVPLMLGAAEEKPTSPDGKLMSPVAAHGLYTNSVGYLVPAENATVWRGPMASKALSQIVNETLWPDLDYLVVDMPPGTGDIQLTMSQQMPVTGAVVITTPQDLALADAIKGVNMFQKVHVPVVGVVENMSYHICSQCGHHEAIFGTGGAEKMARDYAVPLLAQLPLHIRIREDIDQGVPTVAAAPDSEHAQAYLELAGRVASRLYWHGQPVAEQIRITTL
ncbi:iron-sulfur cluster carrier protein ApbC [Photobacterium sp. 1_MG-2023]|uniref:iron-sulfur cluster carrier protein ApbC n=1 Tax=Photobacterium sp. 1_MG-2023 TaxID=3062646 RepID=UPI0026E1C3EF|nr:iron-sulfur cluster carrier protein ApbC [Photobacterium sp. 1_MG-2023]MDO6705770.1 iron-sulfur cluster carrier protein ApbC [Photobacterium sp. 1_MG-2023]